jgi:hypothetical protein
MRAVRPARAGRAAVMAAVVCATAACAAQDGPGPLALTKAQWSADALSEDERVELDRLTGYAEDELMLAGGAAVLGAVVFGVLAQDWGGAAFGGLYGGLYGGLHGGALGARLGDGAGAYDAAYDAAIAEGRTEAEAGAAALEAAEAAAVRAEAVATEARRRADAQLDAGADAEGLRVARARAVLIDGLAAAVAADSRRLRRVAEDRSWEDVALGRRADALEAAARRIGADGAAVAGRLAVSSSAEPG